MPTPVPFPVAHSNSLVVGKAGSLTFQRRPGSPPWSAVYGYNAPPGMTFVTKARVTTGNPLLQNPSAYIELTGTPTQSGVWQVIITAAADGAVTHVLTVPVGVDDAEQVDTTQASTPLRMNVAAQTLYSPTDLEGPALRVTTEDRLLVGLTLENEEGPIKVKFLSHIDFYLSGERGLPCVLIASAQPVIRGREGNWSYQVILELGEEAAPGITELVDGMIVGQAATTKLFLYARLYYYRNENGTAGTRLLNVTAMPTVIHVTKYRPTV